MNFKVNCLIIGAQKAGTTSLYHYIKQHSDIYFSEIKEITYFVDDSMFKKGVDYYHSFFSNYTEQKIIASSYVHMLPSQKAPSRVFDYNPNMKFIVMVRDPVDRAYSAYKYAQKNGWENENIDFDSTFHLEKERIINEQFNLTYFYNSLYSLHLKNWYLFFPSTNFLIIEDSDLKSNPVSVLKMIFEFLSIKDESNTIDVSKKYNKAGKIKFKRLQTFLLSKDSSIKITFSKILPKNARIWLRAKIFTKLYAFNQIDADNDKLDRDIRKRFEDYFNSKGK